MAAVLALWPTPARASDCPPEDPSRSDCRGAATTARNPLVPIGGAAAGGLVGWMAGNSVRPRPKPEKGGDEPRTEKDPCLEDLERVSRASANARLLQGARQNLQSMLNLLETQYENTREAAYLSGAIDLGFIGGSIWTKPLSGLLGREAVKQALKQKLAEAALKALGKEASKAFMRTMTEQGWTWDKFVDKPLGGALKKQVQESLKDAITAEQMGRFARMGIDPKGPVGRAVQEGIKTELAGPLSDAFGNFLSLASMAEGAISGAEKLEAIRAQMRAVREKLFDIETRFEDALTEMELARSALEHCRRIWAK
jgi:hypothetical protein